MGGRWEHSSKGANGKSGELLCSEFRTLSPSLSWLQYTFPRFLCTPPLSLSQTPQTIHHPCPSMQTCTGSSKSPAPCLCTVFTARPPPKEDKCEVCRHHRSAHVESPPKVDNKYVERLLKSMNTTAVHEEARKEMAEGFRPEKPPATLGHVRISILRLCSDLYVH